MKAREVGLAFVREAVRHGPEVLAAVKAIWQGLQGEDPELREAPRASTDEAVDARIDEELARRGVKTEGAP